MNKTTDLSEGPIIKSLISFTIPIMLGQLLQQFYNLADAWVIGNFTDNASFAAVSSSGNLSFFVVGFFSGIAIGGGVVISRYFGAKDEYNVDRAIHTNILFGLIASAVMTVIFLILVPYILQWMKTPETVYPHSLAYFRIYFAGIGTIIMYNFLTAIMRALGDSKRPVIYLLISTVINIVLDLIFVAVFKWGVSGASLATVIAQGISVVLCIIRMSKGNDFTSISLKKLKFYPDMMKAVIRQGLPSGIQYSALSIGNMVIQSQINGFGEFAMAGIGAHSKIEGFVFIPITSISSTMSTFVSQNLGAGKPERARKGAFIGVISGVVLAQLIGIIMYIWAPAFLKMFCSDPAAVEFGTIHCRIVTIFYFILSYSHCASGVLRGCGKAVVPMIAMLAFWCVFRVIYISIILNYIPEFSVIGWAYPISWAFSSLIFFIYLRCYKWKDVGTL